MGDCGGGLVRRALGWICVLCVFAMSCAAVPVTILYTNDIHLRFGRLASLEQRIAAERAGDVPVLLFDAGDAWQDFRTPLAAVWGADEMVAWMNRVGYDGMALGNHDMYWGRRRLEELAEEAAFPILCANLEPVRGGVPFVPSVRVEAGGISVLAIGLITEEWLPYSAYPALRVIPGASALRREIDRRATPSDLVLVLAHLPVADATRIASVVPEIDVFLTGHSHEETPDPVSVGETLIVQSGAFGERLGRLSIDVDPETGSHRLIANELLATVKAPTEIGRGLAQLLWIAAATAAAAILILR